MAYSMKRNKETSIKCSARMAVLDWPGKEMLVVADEESLQGSLCKLGKLESDFSVIDILMLNLSETLGIRLRQKANGVQVFTVDLRRSTWSTMEEAMEEVLMNKWRIGSAIVHDEVALEVVQAVEEGLECYELQVRVLKNLK